MQPYMVMTMSCCYLWKVFIIFLQIPESTWAVDQALQGSRRLPCREKVMQSISMFYTKSDDAAELRIYPVLFER